jgi:hypothetical protein
VCFTATSSLARVAISRDLTHVGVILQLTTATSTGSYGKRPANFSPRTGSGVTRGTADQPCGSSSQSIQFKDHGQRIDAYVDFGAHAARTDEPKRTQS